MKGNSTLTSFWRQTTGPSGTTSENYGTDSESSAQYGLILSSPASNTNYSPNPPTSTTATNPAPFITIKLPNNTPRGRPDTF